MKTYSLKSAAQDQENTSTVWEAFVSYLESVYFEGAAETLEPELVNFEYQTYKSCYGN
jgi:hypothetical protein